MKRFGSTHVRGVDINGIWHRISKINPDQWLIKYNPGSGEIIREFGCELDAQYFLNDRKNRRV